MRRPRVLRMVAWGAVLLLLPTCSAPAGPPEELRQAIVRRGTFLLDVEVSGAVTARTVDPLGPPVIEDQWEFNIAFMAPEGSEVSAGDLVLRFDAAGLDQRLTERMTEAARADEELEKRQLEEQQQGRDDALKLAELEAAERKATMLAEGSPELVAALDQRIATLDLTLARSEVESFRARVVAGTRLFEARRRQLEGDRTWARDRVDRAKADRGKLVVQAPRAGVVLYVARGGGEKRKVGDRVWRADRPIQVVSEDQLYLDLSFDEAWTRDVSVGQRVRFHAESRADEELRGTVGKIGGSHVSGMVRIEVEVAPDAVASLRPGMRIRGHVEVARVEGALLVPLGALVPTDGGPGLAIPGQRGDTPVRLGRRNTADVEVISGIEEGTAVEVAAP